jgi:hypothetical protein
MKIYIKVENEKVIEIGDWDYGIELSGLSYPGNKTPPINGIFIHRLDDICFEYWVDTSIYKQRYGSYFKKINSYLDIAIRTNRNKIIEQLI